MGLQLLHLLCFSSSLYNRNTMPRPDYFSHSEENSTSNRNTKLSVEVAPAAIVAVFKGKGQK